MSVGDGWRQILGAGLPAGIALVVLSAIEVISPATALIVWVATFIVSAFFAIPRARSLRDLEEWTARLGNGEPVPPPESSSSLQVLMRNLGALARRLERQQGDHLQSASLLEMIIEGIPTPLLVIDQDDRVLRANSAAADLFGTSPVGHALLEVVRVPEVAEALVRARGEHESVEASFVLPNPDGRILQLAVRPLEREGKHPPEVLLLFEDRTATERRDQIRGSFIANASHEIRTPLTAIIGIVETLSGPARDDPEARERYLGRLGGQAKRIQTLVDNLLSLSRVEMTEGELPREELDLVELARSVVRDTDWQALERNIDLRIKTPEGPVKILGDELQLRQMLINLVDNAIRYGHRGGQVSVEVEMAENFREASVVVEDDGPGISPDEVDRIFERFYRTEAARQAHESGHGLGLAIVKHVSLRHRGRLDIDSELGRGSRFVARLPAARDTRQEASKPL